ncbi:TlpA family protein disulfide reductase [Weeksellaceae bacterium KMM 9724]|uniref:TlpA family protein disulfide reductase n=1 Tax=Profundicola chukchiensis TaxID=2961959 RepID=UPI00243C67C5|nr:TlpA disulfide reductase family protein [Profundicola chukchiensis]MDG4951270.1 TlpA family protein disulfide reductase [Profundicola chukchiensis]
MGIIKIISISIFSVLLLSCKVEGEIQENTEPVASIEPNLAFDDVVSDFNKWWTYHNEYILLSSNFTGLNEESDTIEQKQFLEQLTTGNYIPLKIDSNDNSNTYKLFELDSTTNKNIVSTIKSESQKNLKYYNMLGSQFPEFEFTDLEGVTYSNENTKGKTIVLKTWFINCKACILEFPELNDLVDKYQEKDNIVFLSIALDEKVALEKFMKTKEFKYKVIPNQSEFITETLGLYVYPTHIIIDQNGIIRKVVNNASLMIDFLENEIDLTEQVQLTTPPPMQ